MLPLQFRDGVADAAEEPSVLNRRAFLTGLGLASGALMLGLPGAGQAAVGETLQGQVVSKLRQLRAEGVIRADEETAWSVYDFTGRKKLVAINEDMPRQAASMVKPLVAQAYFFTAARRGSGVSYNSAVRGIMERMIRHSDNSATNEIMGLVSQSNGNAGPQAVEIVLKRNAPGIFRQTSIVEYIPSDGRTYRNKASAHDYSRFLLALWKDELPFSGELRSLMALPNKDRIVHGVRGMPTNVRVYDKTGSTAQLCGNMGIIECRDVRGQPRPYTFVGIIEKSESTTAYGTWITNRANAIRQVSGVVHDYMRTQHRLA